MPPPTTPGQPPPPTTTTPEMAAAALLATGTLSRTDITTTTTTTLRGDEQPPAGPSTSSTTSSSTAKSTTTDSTPKPTSSYPLEAPKVTDNDRFGIPPRVGTNGTNNGGAVPPALSVRGIRDDGAVVCERHFGVTGAYLAYSPVSLTAVAIRVLTVTKEIIAVCIIGVVLLFCVAGTCWEAIERWRERRRMRGDEGELEVQQGLGTGAEGDGALGGELG